MMFEVVRFPTKQRMLLTLSGFLSVPDFLDMRERLAVESAKLGDAGFDMLVDSSRSALQPQEVVEMSRHILAGPLRFTRRIAVGVGQSVSRMQMRRVLVTDAHRLFATVTDAAAWLDAELGIGPVPAAQARLTGVTL